MWIIHNIWGKGQISNLITIFQYCSRRKQLSMQDGSKSRHKNWRFPLRALLCRRSRAQHKCRRSRRTASTACARGLLPRARRCHRSSAAVLLYCYCLDGGHYEDTRERALRGRRRHPRRRYCIELSLFVGQGFANLPGFCGAGTRGWLASTLDQLVHKVLFLII